MNTQRLMLAFVFVIVLAALGCKNQAESPKPIGEWTKNPNRTHSVSPGILEFRDNSHFSFIATQEGHTDSKGRYSILDGKITFEDDTCYNAGTYTYLLENTQLTLEVISDTCQHRAVVISGIWQRTAGGVDSGRPE